MNTILRRIFGRSATRSTMSRKSKQLRKQLSRKSIFESLERREVFDAGWAVGMQGATVTEMVTDAAGNTFITGGAPGGQAVFGNGTLSTGSGNLYVAKCNSNGQFLWAVKFGSTSSADTGSKAIALDTSGNAIIAGKFIGSVQFGSLALTSAGGTDAFLAKLDGNDGHFVWAQSRGGTGDDLAFDVAVDFNDNAILAGGMDSVFANDQGVAAPLVFVSKVDMAGTEIWASSVTGNASNALSGRLESLAVDTSGAIYASGRFKGTADFPTGALSSVAYLPTYNGGLSADPLVSKLDSNGQWLWARSFPVDTTGIVYGSVVGSDGQLYIAGGFDGTAHFDSTTLTSAGKRDGFVSRLDPTTGVVGWAQRFGGTDVDTASAIQIDSMGRPVVVGTFNGTAVFGSQTLIANPTQNPFISVFSNSGTLLESHRLGNGANTTYGVGLGIDTSGAIYTSGSNAGVQTMQLPQQQLTLGTTGTSLNGYIVKLPPAASTKFYVVDDSAKDRTYQYASSGELTIDNFSMNTGNTAPRGAASNAAGTTVWVADKNRNVYVYNNSGASQGSWQASSLSSTAQVEGVATNGTDVWIVDNKTDKVYKHTGAASRISGSQSAASSFSLNSANTNPKGIVTDGVSIWVVNDSSTDKIFKYTVSGSFLGSWIIDSANTSPTGLTIDPTNGSQDIWVVDNGTDKIYQYANSRGRTSGSQVSSATYALAVGNTNPQGIADPPPPSAMVPTSNENSTSKDLVSVTAVGGLIVMPSIGTPSSMVNSERLHGSKSTVQSTDNFMSNLGRSSQLPQTPLSFSRTQPSAFIPIDSNENDEVDEEDYGIDDLVGLVANNLLR